MDIFTEDMTPDELKAKVFEVMDKSKEEREEAGASLIRVLGKKIIDRGEWTLVDV